MKLSKLWIVTLLLLMTACSRKQDAIVIVPDCEKNHLQQNHLFGPVKEITTTRGIASDTNSQSADNQIVTTVIQQYSPDGFLTFLTVIDAEKDTLFTEHFHYSDEAKLLSNERIGGDGGLLSRTEFSYNDLGFKSGESFYLADSLIHTISYKSDDRGNVIEMSQRRDGVTITNKLAYNNLGLVAQIDEFEPNGKRFKYVTIEYDNFGDEVNRRAFKQSGQQIEYTYTQYDQEGRLLKVIYEDMLHELQEIKTYSKHDARGNWLREVCQKNGENIYYRNRTIIYY